MQALRLHDAGTLRLVQEPEPRPGPGEALLRITCVGLCGSDLTWFDSSSIGGTRLDKPLILGHEFAAVAETGMHAGRRVAVDPADPCGTCERCQEGDPNLCEAVRFAGHAPHDGALRQFMAWPESLLHPLPDNVSDADGAMLEPLGVALHAMDLAKVRIGHVVAVLGCGPIGLLLVQLARLAGASRVLAAEPLAHRLEAAHGFGAEIFSAQAGGEVQGIMRATNNKGVDVVLEAAGENPAVEAAMAVARPGATVVLAGIPRDDRIGFRVSEARRKGLTIKLVRRMKHTYPRAIDLAASGRVDVSSLVTRVFPLHEAEQAFSMASARQGLKICLDPRLA